MPLHTKLSCIVLNKPAVSYVRGKIVLPTHTRTKTFVCQTRSVESNQHGWHKASFFAVATDSDTPQCSYCFPKSSRIMAVMAVVRSQITAIGIPLSLALHAVSIVGTCSRLVFQSSRPVNANCTPKGMFVKCALKVQDGCNAKNPRGSTCSERGLVGDRRIFLRNFSTLASSTMVQVIF